MLFKGYKANVNGIETYQEGLYIVQGITRSQTYAFENQYGLNAHGSNGTYLMTDNTQTVTEIVLYVYDLKKVVRIDIREKLLEFSGKQRLTKKFLAKVKEALPNKIWIANVDGEWILQNDAMKQLYDAVISAK